MPAITVARQEVGQRLDRYLRKILHHMPTSHIFKLLRTRKVRVNGHRAQGKEILELGDEIIIHMAEEQFKQDTHRTRRSVRGVDFRVVFEDDFVLVVSKPARLPVHPGAGHEDNSLIDQVHAYLHVPDRPAAFRPSLVHRLDRDTSGLLVIGKTNEVVKKLGQMFAASQLQKYYVALVKGIIRPAQGMWELEVLRRDIPGHRRPPSEETHEKPLIGKTRYRVAKVCHLQLPDSSKLPLSLLVLQLLTGRTHQIRSHLYQVGHPLAGDPRYGDPNLNRLLKKEFRLRRQFLHAYRLEFDHPVSGKLLRLTDPFPNDLLPIVKTLRLDNWRG